MRYRYSRWNGVQTGVFPDADDLLDRFADELLAGKDPQRLLQNALQRGIQDAEGGSTPGIRDLLQEIDAARQRELARFDLDTVLHDIVAELAEIAKLERAQLDGDENPKVDASSPTDPTTQQPGRSMLQGQQPDSPPGGPAAPDEKDRNENPAMGCDCCGSGGGGCCDGGGGQGGAPSSNPRPGDYEIQDWDQKSSGVLAPAYDDAPTNGRSKGKRDVRNILSRFASRRRTFLAGLPASPAAQFGAFTGYDFVAPEAWERFRRLRSSLADRLKRHYFPDIAETVAFGEGEASFRDLVDALNRSLQEEAGGAEGALADFRDRHRDRFGRQDDMVAALSRQIALMESLLASLTPEVREQLQQLKAAVLHDELPEWELTWLQANLTAYQRGPQPRAYRFSGQEALDLGSALDLMDRLDRLHRLQQQVQTTTPARIDEVDAETVRQLLGEEAYEALRLLQETCEALQRAGYLERRGARLVLTARGIRKLGDRAARDIFAGLKRDCLGRHQVGTAGIGFDRMDERKSYEFGDPFILDAEETIRHAVVRGGAGCPVRLVADDFVVYRSEALTRAATVLMLDLSRSMIVRGCFVAARRVALALHSLIRERFPQDTLYVLGFSDRARELALDSLPEISWDDHATNMQDAFRLARRLLGRHSSANRQIVLVTDGEPTAHLEGDRVEFSYPPSPETLEATLREVRCCTRDRIVINTFMLERGHYLTEFVEQMARINRGRAFFATPERLGEYVLADYLTKRILRHLWP